MMQLLLCALTLAMVGQATGGVHTLCSASEAEAHVQRFKQQVKTNARPMHCPSHHWLRLLAEQSSRGHKVFFDIGCNKGYEVAKLLQLWTPKLSVTPSVICEQQAKMQGHKDCSSSPSQICGACRDCRDAVEKADPLDQDLTIGTSLDIHCFEASNPSAKRLQAIRDKYVPLNGKHNVTWQVHAAALGDHGGTIKFPRNCSLETCSTFNLGKSFEEVPLTSIDLEMEKLKLPYIDFVKIDTEGNDPDVLAGAGKALREHRIGMMSFEVNRMGRWFNVTLEDTVHRLGKFGMLCYMVYGDQYYRLTGCWHPGFEIRSWANVFCIHGGHFLFHTIDNQAVYRQVFRR